MNPIEKEMMIGMINLLNQASQAYYSGKPIMDDNQFDARLEDLKQLEDETGVVFANSPTQTVGAKVLTELPEVKHNHKMLSLDKCHFPEEVIKFANNKELVASIKLDGMTTSLLYENGILVRGESRGNGHVGNDITEHVKQFLNVPLKINKEGTYTIDGEAVILDEDFAEINQNNEFKNSRNLVAGTLSSLDTSVVSQRKVKFIAWDVIDGGNNNSLKDNLNEAKELGFDTVPFWSVANLSRTNIQNVINYIFEFASDEGYPCDGVVFKFNNIEYGKSLGATSHHFRNGIAYKAENSLHKTELINLEWSMGKTGQITPIANFKPVEIEGTTVEKASLSNISVMEDTLGIPFVGEEIFVSKRNMIIPKVENANKISSPSIEKAISIPSICPVCGGKTEIKQDNDSKVLMCTNNDCKGKLLGKLTHFVSKNAMNIECLSESTLEKFIELGWLTKFIDIYYLDVNKKEMMQLEGFGEKSVKKLLNSIEKSKNTTLDRFIYALSIPDVGRSTAKTIASRFKDFQDFIIRASDFNWEELDGIGSQTALKINEFIKVHIDEIRELAKELEFEEVEEVTISNNLTGITFCITGGLNHFANRDEVKEKIRQAGGRVIDSVSANTNYLVCNEESNSSKYKKAKKMGIPVISEEELIKILNS